MGKVVGSKVIVIVDCCGSVFAVSDIVRHERRARDWGYRCRKSSCPFDRLLRPSILVGDEYSPMLISSMKTFPCRCGNSLFFHSVTCVDCGFESGMCPACNRVVPMVSAEDGSTKCGNPDCGVSVVKCENYHSQQICNRLVLVENQPDETFCDLCRLTTVIPDLQIEGNQQKWQRLERAKRRVLYTVKQVGLPIEESPGAPVLSFEFKSDGDKPVPTGHDNGCITINIREADSVERERTRVDFGEPHRTLVGHFRHELGHYFWDRLVKENRESEFREIFGDERSPTYEDAMDAYYQQGPKPNWKSEYISAYATMHPWEDFAETFSEYLDMVSVLDTANHFQLTNCDLHDFEEMFESYRVVGVTVNEFNRDMGLLDLVPHVFVDPVITKLRFIHSLRVGAIEQAHSFSGA